MSACCNLFHFAYVPQCRPAGASRGRGVYLAKNHICRYFGPVIEYSLFAQILNTFIIPLIIFSPIYARNFPCAEPPVVGLANCDADRACVVSWPNCDELSTEERSQLSQCQHTVTPQPEMLPGTTGHPSRGEMFNHFEMIRTANV